MRARSDPDTRARETPQFSFHDAKLRSRPLLALNQVGRALAALGLDVPSLSIDSILSAAKKRSGEPELGGDSYREPLERYLDAVHAEADLNTFGRIAIREILVGSLANRSQLAAWAREHPKVRGETIAEPWVILGLPRTGTSLLSILLGLDPESRALLHWEGAHPIPPPTLADAAEDPRIARNAKELESLLKLNPALGAMHPFGATIAQECVALFMYDIRTLGVETQAYVPSYGRWLQTCDMAPAYAQHKLALQTLQSTQPTGRWVMKTPNHLWCLDTLLDFYPDARVIWTHRDPGRVTTSLASLVNSLQGMFTRRNDPKRVAEEWLGKSEHAIRSGMDFDARAPAGWCEHIRYVDLVDDPIGTVRKVYARYGEEVSPLHERRMQIWLEDRGQDAAGRHVYDPADFGWSYPALAERFRDYQERYDVPVE